MIEARLPTGDGRAVVSLHPRAAERYRQKVADIHDALTKGDAASVEAVALVRDLIGEIRIIPKAKGEPVILEIAGDLAALMVTDAEIVEHGANAVTASVVAGAGFSDAVTRHRKRGSGASYPYRFAV